VVARLPGQQSFNSFGNLALNPEAALLFFDFATGRTLHLSGTTEIEWENPTGPETTDTPAELHGSPCSASWLDICSLLGRLPTSPIRATPH
jgi:hypothetical protein